MEYDPQVPTYQTSDPTSFAFISARERWPAIVTGAIDDVHRTVASLPDSEIDAVAEGKSIVAGLATLKYELQHNRALTPIPDDGQPDVAGYHAELAARGPPTWHDVEWLYSECYLYRRMATLFSRAQTPFWKSYDVFQRQKMDTFKSSRPAVLELAGRYRDIITQIRSSRDHKVINNSSGSPETEKEKEAEKMLFVEMAEICLWGNATDLSLLTSLTYEDLQKLQGSRARKESEKNVLVNDLGSAFEVLYAAQRTSQANATGPSASSRRVDIVLDNAGFELFVDLILAGYLLATGLATEVVLHPKSIPWFVSDVVPADFAALLNAMQDPKTFYAPPAAAGTKDRSGKDAVAVGAGRDTPALSDKDAELIQFLFDDWSSLHAEGQLILRPSRFWTHAGSFWRMPHTAPEVFEDLKESELVIFKGDLNYRKLTGDAAWSPTTPFTTAIGPLGPSSGIRTLALRTCKADVVVGLPEGKDEEIRKASQGDDVEARKWAWSGKWAVVQFSDGKA
ncbi:hypothetical protein A1O1_08577 [Capronia coronata CBS 617.96]|uniref:Sugar phosphate phosphatase n=1 Tax=Capronia coronata CBS 617.96 TaxID=1182541 RepID=W9XIV7_9EURO|nr:uncharacterized protein A1O1_08577 [Capronia coronata CBS 617.96]EXJ80432.1 hypothetical protein A1O1_08577 [Capronia coronata CBS 617.96]